MKSDNRLTRLAQVLVRYSLGIKERDKVSIAAFTGTEPLVREIYEEVLRAGAHPTLHIDLEGRQYLFYKVAQDFQIEYTDPFLLYELEHTDALIHLMPGSNPHEMTSIDPGKQQKAAIAQKPIMETFLKRWGEGSLRWVASLCPTPALAQEARMSLDEYSEFVFSCMNLNDADPVKFWETFSIEQEKICDRLNRSKEVRIVGQDTDLRFRCEGRKWMNCDGHVNFPDGEVYTGPIEDSVEGTIRFTYPGIYQGQEVEDISLRFEKGKVLEGHAAKGEKLLHNLLDVDEGARYVGEIAIGTNVFIDRFTKNMLFDEKMAGTVHLAIGAGLPPSGSKNLSGIHWDMLKDMRDGGEIYVDGKLVYRDGVFLK
ncbi:MAG: aminopeptidase [Dehalococcoidia bacterium]